ncbi:MAG: Membrane protein insertase YidC, partial [Verrucomicrobiota bacterium]
GAVAGGELKGAQPPVAAAGSVSAQAGSTAPAPAAPAAPGEPKRVEKVVVGGVEWHFTNVGGGLERVVLQNHRGEGDGPIVLNEFGGVPVGALTEAFENPVLDSYAMERGAEGKEMTFRRVDARQLEVVKKFRVGGGADAGGKGDSYVLDLEVRFTNRSAGAVTVPNYAVRLGSGVPLHAKDLPTYTGINRMLGGASKFKDVSSFRSGGFLGIGSQEVPLWSESGAVTWAGVTNQYYSTIVAPVGAAGSEVLARRVAISEADWKSFGRSGLSSTPLFGVDGALRMPMTTLDAGKEHVQRYQIFAGPREHRLLSALGGGQEQMLDFGMFSVVSRVLLSSMNGLKGLLGSYAAAIVVLTLIIKSLMWPLQNKATASMKKMQALQPKMNELKEKYGNDPQRMNQELLGLYKKHGVNPMSGCFPMLIQIPIFFGFYNMLGKAVELRNSAFLWVKDLSQPDTVAMVLGYPVNVLPIVMAATMLWQMRLTPKTGDPVQQRMFMFMPLIMIVFCYNFASALALYWTVQNLFSVVQLWVTNRQAAVGAQSVIASPSKRK